MHDREGDAMDDRYEIFVRTYAERPDWRRFTDAGSAWMGMSEAELRELAVVFPDRAELIAELDSDELATLLLTRDYGEADRKLMGAVRAHALPIFCGDVYDHRESLQMNDDRIWRSDYARDFDRDTLDVYA